jgi:GT2 family glycosyltransferase
MAVDSVLGACLMYRRDILQQVGYLDERFFMYGEEVDFCKRVKEKGWEVFYYPYAEIIHWGDGSSRQDFQKYLIEQHKARRMHMKKYFSKTKAWMGTQFILWGLVTRIRNSFITCVHNEKLSANRFR